MLRPRAIIIALAAVMISITTVLTMLVKIPIAGTEGYFNFSDVATYFAAFTFGPWIGFVAGGIGAATADLLLGYGQWAPITLLAHGLQGLVAGYLGRGKGLPGMLLGWVLGTGVMVSIYLFGEVLVVGSPFAKAAIQVPFNLVQNLAGALVGIPLFYAVRRAYPPVTRLTEPKKWQEG